MGKNLLEAAMRLHNGGSTRELIGWGLSALVITKLGFTVWLVITGLTVVLLLAAWLLMAYILRFRKGA